MNKYLKTQIGCLILALASFCLPAGAAMITDNFNSGASSSLWDIMQTNVAGASWTIQNPDSAGRFQVSKSADTASEIGVEAAIWSRFTLDGDFTASVDFNLLTFPLVDTQGWNIAVISLFSSDERFFCSMRISDSGSQQAEGFKTIGSPDGQILTNIADTSTAGTLGVTRIGQTLSAWIDRGSGRVPLGSYSASDTLGPMKVRIYAAQVTHYASLIRPHTALDVAFDNFTATAETIVPEPITLLSLILGGLTLIGKRRG
jgi:hypothetical protein